MCLIVFYPKIENCNVNYDILERGFERNSHGAGFCFIRDNKIIVRKKFIKYSSFKRSFVRDTRGLTGPVLIHFRLATCGPQNKTNTQPIPIRQGEFVMVHNGVFSSLSLDGSRISDSVRLAKMVGVMNWSLPFNRGQVGLLGALCDTTSKLVFMDNTGKYRIINAKAGSWRHGVWYSNTHSFETVADVKPSFGSLASSWYDDDELPVAKRKPTVYKMPQVMSRPVSTPPYSRGYAFAQPSNYNPWSKRFE